jgi:hypothetical protein
MSELPQATSARRRSAERHGGLGPVARMPSLRPRPQSAPSSPPLRDLVPARRTAASAKFILLDRDTWEPVGSSASGGYGPAWWLSERDAARAAANDPRVQAVQREIDRQTRLAANHGLDPLIPEQAAQIAAIRRAQRPDPLAA